MSQKWNAPTLSTTNWYEFKNGKPCRNRIIDTIWKVKVNMVMAPKPQQNTAKAFETYPQSFI